MSRADGHVAVSVDDEGPGIAAADRDRVFEPFARVAGGDSVDHRGTGLGLALSRRLARAAGGDVRVASDEDGACFLVELPA
jgi:signal transduction histidine kinase